MSTGSLNILIFVKFLLFNNIYQPLDPATLLLGFLSDSVGKESACKAGDLGLILALGRSPEGGYGNPLHYSCLEKPHGQRSLMGSQRVRHDSATKHTFYS